jgi:hypothetical protein
MSALLATFAAVVVAKGSLEIGPGRPQGAVCDLVCVHTIEIATRREWQPAKASPAKPRAVIAQVEGSGAPYAKA